MAKVPHTYIDGLQIAIAEAESLLSFQHEGVDALNAKARSMLNATSMIIALVGTLQLIFTTQKSATFWIILSIALLLYAVLILFATLVQQPLVLKGPIKAEWSVISVQYARETKEEMFEQRLSDLLNAIKLNEPNIKQKKRYASWASWLLPVIVVFLIMLALSNYWADSKIDVGKWIVELEAIFLKLGEVIMIQDWVVDLSQVAIAAGTLLVAILAIWGDLVRAKVAGPKLELKLRETQGNLTTLGDVPTFYWHIRVTNRRSWSPAKSVRVLCTEIKKRVADGTFQKVPLAVPLQLTWVFPDLHELLPTISSDDTCDLGRIVINTENFSLSVYIFPNNFQGYIGANEAMEISLEAVAENYRSKPYRLRISWDGEWDDNPLEMEQHFEVIEIK